MWLMNAKTCTLSAFYGAVPQYAIISHRWHEEEVLFDDVQNNLRIAQSKKGWWKINLLCRQALKDGLLWVWIDTCCINKTSSAELTEAINSMFVWYRNASICYAYLDDMHDIFESDEKGELRFASSAWFTRGWTLQELLAPPHIVFFANGWRYIGTRDQLADHISEITDIDIDLLRLKRPLRSYTIAQRFAWAAGRSTTRVEDEAYSLLGIFDVNMPLLYGEGSKAMRRLQEEILRRTTELSILAWDSNLANGANQALAASASQFRGCQDIVLSEASRTITSSQGRIVASNASFNLTGRILLVSGGAGFGEMLVVLLDCRHENDITTVIGLRISPISASPEIVLQQKGPMFCTIGWQGHPDDKRTFLVDAIQSSSAQIREIVVNFDTIPWAPSYSESMNWTHVWVRFSDLRQSGHWMTRDLRPKQYWNPNNRTFDLERARADKLRQDHHKPLKVKQSCLGLPIVASIVLTHLSSKAIRLIFRQVNPSLESGVQFALQPCDEAEEENANTELVDVKFGSQPCSLSWPDGAILDLELKLERMANLNIAHLAISIKQGRRASSR